MTDQTTDSKTLSLFYSYSHKDERYRDQLATHLKILERQSIISAWHDRQITAGEEWAGEIDEHLNIADIILLLVSPDFIASDYCWGIEVETAMRRHVAGEALVVPVIVRPVDWTSTLFSKLQALPKDGKAVTLWSNRDKAWVDVAKGIRRAAKEVAKGLEQQVPQVPSAPAAVQVSEPATPARAEPVRPAIREGGQLRRTIFTARNGNTLPGDVVRSEGDSPTGDADVDDVYDAFGSIYDFYWTIFQRDSVDNQGMPLSATVHYSQKYSNAFWNGSQFIFGDGDGELFNRFTTPIDLPAREFALGIVQHDAKLVYQDQSGALTSSLGDVFATLVKQYVLKQTAAQADWLLGAGLFTPAVHGIAIRSMAAPGSAYDDPVLGKDPQPGHMQDYARVTYDNGGAHINSGIPSRAFYLLAVTLTGYAWERAGRIWYAAMQDDQLKPKAQFRDFAQITVWCARRLYGEKSVEAQATKTAWGLVGIKA